MTIATFTQEQLKRYIRDIPDFPKRGILFRDITPLLQSGAMFRKAINQFADRYATKQLDAVVAVESRGLIFGAALADRLGVGLVLVRKAGKLPHKTIKATYTLEYGEGALEMHADSLPEQARVVLIDDLLATGGTTGAVVKLLEHFRAHLVEVAFLIELTALEGRKRLGHHPIFSLLHY
ncbi:MAG: adenine phosphoribosyltransferase [Candidatus Omnitrophica bacterium]|nr:adenine phosphoribosyltransferase [Candidatus Omnitrophota bacterium]